jgi:hypothetical protein
MAEFMKKGKIHGNARIVQARAAVSSGTKLVVTDQPVNGTTQSGSNFNILTTSTTSSTQPN